MSGQHDTALVDAARNGSNEAFDTLVDRYRGPVVRLAYRLTHDADEAKDVAQDAFLRAYRGLSDFRPERPFARWLFVIARNASLDAIRRRRRASALENDPALPATVSPEDLAVRREEAQRVRGAMERLSTSYRTALELYYMRGMRYREIASELGVPLGTVKTYISRAKRKLRRELEPERMAA